MKNAKIDWLVEDGDSKSSISPLGINDFSDYQFVNYPLPEKLGKAWIETIRTKDKITLATAQHYYIPQKQNPVIQFGAISENYEEISFYVRLSSRQLRLKNIHGEDCLSFGPGQAAFTHSESCDYVAFHDTTKPFRYTGAWMTDRDLNWLIGEHNASVLFKYLQVDKPPVTKVMPLPNQIANILHHAISPKHTGPLRQLRVQAKTLEFLCALQEFYDTPINLSSCARDKNSIRQLHDTLINLEGKLPSIKEMALLAGMNAQKMNSLFKEEYQLPIHKFITRQRLRDAHTAIQTSKIPLKELASRLGYSHVNHFSNAFKREFGYAPSNLRS